ncbi:forkhead box protein K2 [Sodiomyces alkalinus F11]|uniref:Forkhead box protein K2 n=1 Tax=Sodiomyces alkalinus (strain CBS 110278 / VKM F-3762 / F11) TaxID=1314773 RepID=A0A3N2Q063_SODAK|nr:forkhead box protein K2 [Sodiomyces alkalinus F11]ROT40147.1 forkhead box protein K2 [Sodiomyces alkalinus F11]
MPPSTKRTQRPRRDPRQESSTAQAEESSPTRPAKRRKKAQDAHLSGQAEDAESCAGDDRKNPIKDGDQLLAQIIQCLLCPKEGPVQASKDHANAIHEANRDGVKAYAKIAAQDWTFYVTKLNVNIGRSSEPPGPAAHEEDVDDDDWMHIDLGPSKMVSRQHARIFFSPEDEKWFLEVKGRNGIKINNIPLKQSCCRPLQSGDVLDVGGNEMMFVLPTEISTLHIHQMYLKRAGLSRQDLAKSLPSASNVASFEDNHGLSTSGAPLRTHHQSYNQPIAPTPPNYKRLGTPPPAPDRVPPSDHKSPGYSGSGTLFLSPNEIDLSHDDNKHVKPQFSYAQMITQAIMSAPDGKLNLNGIYTFITTNYAYYRHQPPAGWQNSIRHNLSLNKAFDKVARSTDEPGKGMKWQIVPEAREEMTRTAYRGGRGGHRGSSAPTSPSHLNYITHGPSDVMSRESSSARKKKMPAAISPSPKSGFRAIQMTPDRATRHLPSMAAVLTADGSPLPRSRKAAAGPTPSSCSNLQDQSPTLTSSYLPDEGASFVTPAPHRVHPRLAPPSTAQRPSQHMPTSSPAPFWKYADIGITPLKPVAHLDLSPSRLARGLTAHGSSPPLAGKSPLLSPTRGVEARGRAVETHPVPLLEIDEDQGFDLAKGFQSIGSYHAPGNRGLSVTDGRSGSKS